MTTPKLQSYSCSESLTCLVPHTDEWFDALEASDPAEANAVREMVRQFGPAICGNCGAKKASDYCLRLRKLGRTCCASVRLCLPCATLRKLDGQALVPL